MSTWPDVPEAPRAPHRGALPAHGDAAMFELRRLGEWADELRRFTDEPLTSHYAAIADRGYYGPARRGSGPELEILAVPIVTWETAVRKARALDRLLPEVARLVSFLEGQQRALDALRRARDGGGS